MLLDKILKFFERLQAINSTLFEIFVGFPCIVITEIAGSIYEECVKRKEGKSDKEILRLRIESGEVKLADLPHTRIDGDDTFNFYVKNYEDRMHSANVFVYVETEYNELIHRFFEERKDEVDAWEEKYGCKMMILEDENFFQEMCFPQERDMLRHGLIYNGTVTTFEREYGVLVRPWHYYDLDPDSELPLQEQLSLIAQYMYNLRMY